jgi:hypothetical protein
MPWKECKCMEERPRFVARLHDGKKMAVACRGGSLALESVAAFAWNGWPTPSLVRRERGCECLLFLERVVAGFLGLMSLATSKWKSIFL